MRGHIKALLAASSALALVACGDAELGSSWNQEAGSFIDEGGFGNPTMNHTLIQNGELSFAVALNERFQNEVPTMINFAFDDASLDAYLLLVATTIATAAAEDSRVVSIPTAASRSLTQGRGMR